MKIFIIIAGLVFLGCGVGQSQLTNGTPAAADANAAWEELQQATVLPSPPEEWNITPPTDEALQQFFKQGVAVATVAAQKAKDFYTRFPDSTNALIAEVIESKMLEIRFFRGGHSPEAFNAWAKAQDNLLADSRLTPDDRYDLRLQIVQMKSIDPALSDEVRETECEQGLQELIKEYPQKEDAYDVLMSLAGVVSNDKARAITKEILAGTAPNDVKDQAGVLLRHLDAIGKPLDIQFTAIDGRAVNLSGLKGKVVLVDFWATWCGPCVAEIPDVKEAYEKFHAKGFEIVGINLDEDESRLKAFVAEREMPWPQYFDGLKWQNKFAQSYAVQEVPTMWLVDKKGKVRDINAREGLQEKIEKFLAE